MNKKLLPWMSRKKIQDVLGIDYYRQAKVADSLGFSFKKNKDREGWGLGVGGKNLLRFLDYFGFDWIEVGEDIIFFLKNKKIRRDSL